MIEFKVGDKVVPTESGWDKLKTNCCTGSSLNDRKFAYLLLIDIGRHNQYLNWTAYCYNSDGSLVDYDYCDGHGLTFEDLIPYKESLLKSVQVFQPGDKVRIIQRKESNHTGWHDYYIKDGDVGKIGIIQEIGSNNRYRVHPIPGSEDEKRRDQYFGIFDHDDLEPVFQLDQTTRIQFRGFKPLQTLGMAGIIESEPIQKNSTMNKIITFVKNATLSADEKLLRKYSLKNDCGEVTPEGKEAIIENFYNSVENQAYLLTIAKGLDQEAKDNK